MTNPTAAEIQAQVVKTLKQMFRGGVHIDSVDGDENSYEMKARITTDPVMAKGYQLLAQRRTAYLVEDGNDDE